MLRVKLKVTETLVMRQKSHHKSAHINFSGFDKVQLTVSNRADCASVHSCYVAKLYKLCYHSSQLSGLSASGAVDYYQGVRQCLCNEARGAGQTTA